MSQQLIKKNLMYFVSIFCLVMGSTPAFQIYNTFITYLFTLLQQLRHNFLFFIKCHHSHSRHSWGCTRTYLRVLHTNTVVG